MDGEVHNIFVNDLKYVLFFVKAVPKKYISLQNNEVVLFLFCPDGESLISSTVTRISGSLNPIRILFVA